MTATGRYQPDAQVLARGHEHVAPVDEFQILDGERGRRRHLQTAGLDLPDESAVVAEWLDPEAPQVRADIGRRPPLVLGARTAALHGVAGQELHVCANRRLGDEGRAPRILERRLVREQCDGDAGHGEFRPKSAGLTS